MAAIYQDRDPLVFHQIGEFPGVSIGGENQSLPFIKWGNGDQTGVWLPGAFSRKHGKSRAVEQHLDAFSNGGGRGH